MANELKFLRGSYTKWSSLTKDANSFYIVEEQDGRFSLYLGEKLIADGLSKAMLASEVSRAQGVEGGLNTRLTTLEDLMGGEGAGSVASQITSAIQNLDSGASGKSADELVTVKVTEVNGMLDTVVVTTNDIAKASELTALKNAVGEGFTPTDTVAKAIDANKKAIADEVTRAKAAEKANADDITTLKGSDKTPGSVAKAVKDAKDALLGDAAEGYNTLGKLEDKIIEVSGAAKTYSITSATTEDVNVKEAYKLVDEEGNQVGATIKVYKDSSLKEVKLEEQTLKFTYILANGSENTVGVDVSKFLSETEFKDGLDVVNGNVSVNVGADTDTNKNFLDLEADGDGNKALAVRSIDTDSTILQKDIVVAGMSSQFGAGNYENGNVIPKGTNIYTILQNILCKELYADPKSTTGTMTASIAEPTVSLDKGDTVEVGTLVTMNSAIVSNSTVSTTPQTVEGMTYGYSVADDDKVDSTETTISKSWTTAATGGAYKMSATVTGFNADKTTHVQTTPATVTAKTMPQTVLGCAAEGSNTITVSATGDTFTGSVEGIESVYHCSNLGHTDAAKKTTAIAKITNQVSNAPKSSKQVTVKGVYKYFMGYSVNTKYDQFDSASVRALTTRTGNITKNGTTTIVNDTAITSNGQSIVVACPSKYKLSKVQNGVGASILANFTSVGEVNVTTGSITTTYKVYVYPIKNNTPVEFKNVTLTNA